MNVRGLVAGVSLGLLVAGCADLPRYVPPKTLAYADQGWTPSQRRWFYHTSQGTKIMPYAWFIALEQPQLAAPPFTEPSYLARFGFLPDPVSPENPDGLPVGFAPGESFVEGTTQLEPVVGMTCAACHTGQIEYRGGALRVDGGPAMTDTAAFQQQLGIALLLTDQSEPRFARFADKVLGPLAGQPDRDALKARLQRAIAAGRLERDAGKALYPLAEGFGRLDALGRGANFVFGTLAGDSRNFAVADAPVSYPALWGAPWFDWVQYNGAIRQPMGRNVAEAMGVRSVTKLSGPVEDLYRSTVHIRNIAEMEAQLAGPRPGTGLLPPRWPEDILGPIDRVKAERGRAHFQRLCAGCHDRPWTAADSYGRRYRQVRMLGLDQIGTDRKAAANFVARQAYPNPSATVPVSAAEGLRAVTSAVIQRWYDDNKIPPAERLAMNGYRDNEWRALSAYKARPLEGVWATAPYLHNGSVPTLYQMLLPAERRDRAFYTGSRQFDPAEVGFERGPAPGLFRFDATLPGNTNSGHEFRQGPKGNGVIGPELTDGERWEIVEYLKTL
jgi:processive rubber oxygenase RoxA-like protein